MKETYKERKAMYMVLFIIFVLVLIGPGLSYLFAFIYPRWFRSTFTRLITRMLNFVGVCVIVYLTNPESIEDNFRVQGVVSTTAPKVGGLRQGENSDSDEDEQPTISLPKQNNE